MTLRDLPPLLRDEPAASELLRSGGLLAVPEPARAFVIAGLSHMSSRHPIVVAVPTSTDGERLAHDLRAYLGDDQVDFFPAWETLPFERVSPSVETMGRRLRVMWRLRDPDRMPRVLVAPVRAIVQRLGPHVEDVEPVIVRPGDQIDPAALVEQLVIAGYRREYQVEHRGEVAVRGSIVDVFPSTADAPVRIDLWGDEVDRLTEFAVADQRSTVDVEIAELFGCRELLPTEEVRARAESLLTVEPWGREQWDRLADGQTFDGMESWLPWLTDGEHVILDLVGPDALVVLVEPRRMRDRAKDLLDEEASLASTLAQTWGAGSDREFPRLHLPFDRLLSHTDAASATMVGAPEGPDAATVTSRGWDPVVGGGDRLVEQLKELAGKRYRIVVCADGKGTAARMASSLADAGIVAPIDEHGTADLTQPGVRIVVEPLERGFSLPAVRLAVLAESDVTGRRRAHRRAKPRRATEGFFDDLKPGDHVVHYQHGVAKYGGMVKRAIGGVERDYLLLEYRGGDKLYVPSDQIDAVRHFTGGDSPSLNRLGGGEFQKTKSRVRQEVVRIAQELVVLYRRRVTSEGHTFAADTP
ncbi:MAG: CarD family transcriptional regulator [Acidimicrobiales bacterium]